MVRIVKIEHPAFNGENGKSITAKFVDDLNTVIKATLVAAKGFSEADEYQKLHNYFKQYKFAIEEKS